MAVYEGARPRPVIPGFGLGRRPGTDEPVALPRRRARIAVRAHRRTNRVALLLGGIVVTFGLAFFSLSQSMAVSATGYRLDRLEAQREQLEAQARDLRSDLDRLGREPAIRKQALSIGLGQLDRPVVVQAR
jgi:cell division protein FtsB